MAIEKKKEWREKGEGRRQKWAKGDIGVFASRKYYKQGCIVEYTSTAIVRRRAGEPRS